MINLFLVISIQWYIDEFTKEDELLLYGFVTRYGPC